MATTTNFGWETPDDTDLVKDGAAAIRTALGGVDTSFVDLKGGTTGQLLSKATNTDLDFTWANPTTFTPNYQLINAGGTALTGAATITVSGISSKNSLMIAIEGVSSASASSEFQLRFNSDSGTNYAYAGLSLEGTTPGATFDTARTRFEIAGQGNVATNTANIYIFVNGTNAAGVKPVQINSEANGATTDKQYAFNGMYKGTSAISSVSVISTVGNFDAGTIFVYGA